jgi:hypothetical protein
MKTYSWRTLLLPALAAAIGVLVSGGVAGAAIKTEPSNTSPPAVSGTPTEGQALSSSTGAWKGTLPLAYSYQWRRCDNTGGSCANIASATASDYTLTGADVGLTLRVRVTATNSSGSAGSVSVPTAVVASAPVTTTTTPPPPATGCPSGTGPVTVSQLSLPTRLLISSVSSTPAVIGKGVQDLTVRVLVSDTCNQVVGGALVYITATPYNQFSIPTEVATGADGYATLIMHRLGGFPVSSKQGLLALFVRARKDGEDLLAGISVRRLVSVNVNLKSA